MAYSMDLSRFSLRRFEAVLTTAELIPSRLPLLDHIRSVVPCLEAMGIEDLAALRRLLADKTSYGELGKQLHVDRDYVTLLNREVNSYRTKPMPLARLDCLSADELEALAAVGIRSTKTLYERCAGKDDRTDLAAQTGVDLERLTEALRLSNLVRINGVGPVFAHFLSDLGVNGPEDVIRISTEELVRRYEASVAGRPKQPRILAEDIEYCKKFSEGFQPDIEW